VGFSVWALDRERSQGAFARLSGRFAQYRLGFVVEDEGK